MSELAVFTGPAPKAGVLADAVQVLHESISATRESQAHRDRILAFCAGHDDALHRTCLDGHLTGSALVINHTRDQTLLMLHTKLGLWLQPGGHADGEGHLGSVALKEAEEETGISGLVLLTPAVDCDIHVIPERTAEPEHLHLDVRFVVLAPEGAQVEGNHESQDLRWCTMAEVEAIAGDESLVRLARSGFAAAQLL